MYTRYNKKYMQFKSWYLVFSSSGMVLNVNFDGINPSYDNESYAKMFYVDTDIVVVLKPLHFKQEPDNRHCNASAN